MADRDPNLASRLKDERIVPPHALFRGAGRLDRPLGEPAPGPAAALAPWLARHLPPGVSTDDLMPSFAIEDRALARAPGEPVDPAALRTAVRFARCMDARHFAEIAVDPGTTLHGVGMQAAGLDRSGRSYTCWNLDWPAYNRDNPGLYQSHPFVFAVRADGSAFGVLADTTWRTDIDLSDPGAIRVRAEGTPFAVYVLEAESPAELCAHIADLTGHMPMPPLWALGYHQCRWSYYPAGRALRIAEEFRDRNIPCDVIWFDIDYMQDFRIFSFSDVHFPDPASLNHRLHDMGFRAIWMIDPAPKQQHGDPVYTSGLEGEHFTLDSNGRPFVGSVWAGPSCFPDFTRPETREWWASLYNDFLAMGIDGVWNDMNEPSVFDDRSKTMPETCWHRGGGDLPEAPHAMYHNVYGMLMAQASREGILAANPDKRPFVLTRSNFIGGHRYAATWTGDNAASWTDLALSIPMILSLSLSGQLLSGPDIGGFIDHTEGDPELFARWMGIGCLLPFARAHVARGCIDKEPWSLGAECEDTCRRAIETRYRLLPYIYTLAWRAHASGRPIAAPVWFADSADPALRSEDRAFLLGEDLLVVCDVVPPGESDPRGPVAMPSGDWRPLQLAESDPDLPGLFLRPGAAIPTGPVVQHSAQAADAPLTVFAALDGAGVASGLLYEDDTDGFAFEAGDFRLSAIRATSDSVELEHQDGNRAPSDRLRSVVAI